MRKTLRALTATAAVAMAPHKQDACWRHNIPLEDGTAYMHLGNDRTIYQRVEDGTLAWTPDTGEIVFLPHYCAEVRHT